MQTEEHDNRVATNIKELRILCRLTQDELAFLLGKYMHVQPTNTQVSFHETGRRHVNGVYLQAYAQVFKVSAKLIYSGDVNSAEFIEAIQRWYEDNGSAKQP